MISVRSGVIGILTLLLCTVMSICNSAKAGTKRLSADVFDMPPYGFLSPDNVPTGVYYEITELIASDAGLSMDIHLIPTKRLFNRVHSGQSDLAIFLESDWSREYLVPVEPVFVDIQSVVLAKSKIDISNYQKVKALRLGIIRGTRIGHPIESDYSLQRVVTRSYLQSAKLLESDRVDAIVGVKPSLYWAIRRTGLSFEHIGAPYPLIVSSIWLHCSPSLSSTTIEKLRQSTRSLRQSGAFDKLMQKYMPHYQSEIKAQKDGEEH